MKRLASPVGRRTETGYEAGPSRASGQQAAKLSRSTLRLRKSGARAGDSHSSYSGRSRLMSERTTSTGSTGRRSEKSAEAIVAESFGLLRPPRCEGPNRKESESPMRRGKAMHQKSEQPELLPCGCGEASTVTQSGEAGRATHRTRRSGGIFLRGRGQMPTSTC